VKRMVFSTLFAVLAACNSLGAADWHVYSDGSGDAPTIAAAADSAESGDLVYIHGGTYIEEGILFDGKDVTCITTEGRVYINAPVEGSGIGFTIRSATNAFWIDSVYLRGFDTGIAVEDASPVIWYITIQDCVTGMGISGASAPSFAYSIVDSSGTAVAVTGGTDVLLQNLTIVGCTTGVSVPAGDVTIERNIIYGCNVGVACAGGAVTLTCNDLYSNVSNYEACTAGPTDFFLDPIFCFYTPPSTIPYQLHVDSPCASGNSPCGGFLGFNGTPVCSGQDVKTTTWGEIKSLYR
jgi:hypothetical protein